MDQGKLPLIAPTIELIYESPFCQLFVRMSDVDNNTISADAQLYTDPKRDLFEPRMDKLYMITINCLKEIKKQVTQNPIILSKYLNLPQLDILKASSFHRYITIQVDLNKGENYIPMIEDELTKRFGVSHISKNIFGESIQLKDGLRISFEAVVHGLPIGGLIHIDCPVLYKKKKFEEIKKFFLEYSYIKKRNPFIDLINYNLLGNKWRINFEEEGYPLLNEMFGQDISQIK